MKFVLTADWHIQGDRPRCRLDADWLGTQRMAVRQVVKIAKERGLPLVILGDIFNTPRVSTAALVGLIAELVEYRDQVYIEAGNHDLPYHNYKNVNDCSYGVLRQYFKELHIHGHELYEDGDSMTAAPFGLDAPNGTDWLAFTHQLVFPNEEARPFAGVGKTAAELADQFPGAGWIFTGDYHHAFDVTVAPQRIVDSGEIPEPGDMVRVVNPGCLLRQAADMIDYQCRVAIIDTNEKDPTKAVEWVYLTDPGEILDAEGARVVTDQYLREAEERSEAVTTFLESVRTRGAVSLSFRDNLLAKLADPTIPPKVHAEVLGILNQLNKEK